MRELVTDILDFSNCEIISGRENDDKLLVSIAKVMDRPDERFMGSFRVTARCSSRISKLFLTDSWILVNGFVKAIRLEGAVVGEVLLSEDFVVKGADVIEYLLVDPFALDAF